MTSLSVPSYVNWSNFKRFGKMIPYYICDGSIVQQEALERIVRGTKDATGKRVGGVGYRNLGSSIKQSFLETEKAYKGVVAENGGFFKYAGKTLKNFPGEVGQAWSAGGSAAKAAGKSAFLGGLKGAGGALLKRLPLIGSILYCATEIPNICRATADGGLMTGAAETVKAGTKIVGFTAGAAIGQALCPIPIVGAIVGGMIGEKLGSLVTGKSYTEQKREIQDEAVSQAQSQQGRHLDTGSTNPFANGLTEEQQAQLAQLEEMIANDPQFRTSNA